MSMNFYPGHWYHLYNRGNNRTPIFLERNNYLFFLEKIRSYWVDHCKILAYCLMPNHFHFLIKVNEDYRHQLLNKAIAITLRSYTRAINKRYGRSGSLFQQGTKAKPLIQRVTQASINSRKKPFQSPGEWNKFRNEYPLIYFHYIHRNPVKAGLVKNPEDWEFSSYRDYAALRNGTLPEIELGFKVFGFKTPRDFGRQSRKLFTG